jgi:hypothetical protein
LDNAASRVPRSHSHVQSSLSVCININSIKGFGVLLAKAVCCRLFIAIRALNCWVVDNRLDFRYLIDPQLTDCVHEQFAFHRATWGTSTTRTSIGPTFLGTSRRRSGDMISSAVGGRHVVHKIECCMDRSCCSRRVSTAVANGLKELSAVTS